MKIKDFETSLEIEVYNPEEDVSCYIRRGLGLGDAWDDTNGGDLSELLREYIPTANDLLYDYTVGQLNALLSRCRQNGPGWESKDAIAEYSLDEHLNRLTSSINEVYVLTISVTAKIVS